LSVCCADLGVSCADLDVFDALWLCVRWLGCMLCGLGCVLGACSAERFCGELLNSQAKAWWTLNQRLQEEL
jgi:hypothetical protein